MGILVREALARKVLPDGWTPLMLRSWAKRLEDEKYSVSLPALLRHIADRLDGPLAEAWERSVDVAVVETVKACGGGLPVIPVEKAAACKHAALRALEERGAPDAF